MMRPLVVLLSLFAVVVAASAASAETQSAEARVRRFAVVVSSNDGGRDRVPLRFADSDAAAIADVLRRLGGLRADDLVLVNGVTRGSFQSAFERVRTRMTRAPAGPARRELIVYYSGHSDEQGLLLGGDRLSYRELRQWIDSTNADVRIAILDSCASGALIRLRGGALVPSFLSDSSRDARGHAFLTSSSADEAAQESDRIGAAFFTHYLVSGLRGAADTSRDGVVTLAEAYQFAFNETLGRTERSGAGPQHPAYDIQLAGTGDLVLTDLRSNTANLVLDDKIAGRIYVRDGGGRLLVELRKEPMYPVQLGLGPGKYRVTVDADGRAFQADVTLEEGKVTRLGQPQLAVAQLQPTQPRGGAPAGDGATQPTTVASHAPDGGSALGGYASVGMRYGRVAGLGTILAGAEAGLIFDHRTFIGLAAMAGAGGEVASPAGRVELWQAALVLRYRFPFEGSPFDLTGGVLVGLVDARLERVGEPWNGIMRGIAFEPQLQADVNLGRWLRLGADLGYRLVAAGNGGPSSELRGVTAGGHVQLGWF